MRWFLSILIGALLAWLFAAFFWPWCGPLIFEPCPKFTRVGVVVFTLIGALLSWPASFRWWRT